MRGPTSFAFFFLKKKETASFSLNYLPIYRLYSSKYPPNAIAIFENISLIIHQTLWHLFVSAPAQMRINPMLFHLAWQPIARMHLQVP